MNVISRQDVTVNNVHLTRSNSKALLFANKEKYVGEILNNQPHGQGTYFYSNGNIYIGEFRKSLRHGQGTFFFSEGDRYVGEFCADQREGKGTYFYAGGSRFTGVFHDSSFKEGIYFSDGAESGNLKFLNTEPISDISNLSDPLFLQLLSQQFQSSAPSLYPLGIMSNFLVTHGYEKVGNVLEEVRRNFFYFSTKTEQAQAKKIYQKLQIVNQPVLLLLQSEIHLMGLQMRQTFKGWVDFEIYNTGQGLEFHERHPQKKQKYQTAWKRRVPIAHLTTNRLKQFLGTFKTAKAAYLAVSRLPGIKIISNRPVIWQKQQQGDNCTLMWIFAYLKNNMHPQEYIDMCTLLFVKALRAAKTAKEPNQKLIDALQKKVDKLMKKCFPLPAVQRNHPTVSPVPKKRPRSTYNISTRSSMSFSNNPPIKKRAL